MPDRFANGDPSNDRGGLTGSRMQTGYDPTDKGFWHGGDLKGVISKLDYIQGLGANAIWLTPVFGNQLVQGEGSHANTGYHGYWGLNFTDIDPHLGTRADYKAVVDAAHARGIKVYFDIVINHTGDIIKYRECPRTFCTYRSKADYPYTHQGGVKGPQINSGFQGDAFDGQTSANFQRLTNLNYAYTPYIPAGAEHAKTPAWLNDPKMYHNRGESAFRGESSQYGDFMGLDDVFTENPRVVAGMIDIYGRWIDDFGIDGFRIDTARHVNAEFWQTFIPAMQARARARGIPNFHIFGEVMEFSPGELARFTRVDKLPAVNDFALQGALVEAIAKDGPTDAITNVFRGDVLYQGGEATARQLATLTGNHDVYRFARAVMLARPHASLDEVRKRVRLAYAVILLSRGIPTIYYGDEQGFTGLPGAAAPVDQNSREDMFATRTAAYGNARRLGSSNLTGAGDHFDVTHPLYRDLSQLAHIRSTDPALRHGAQISRSSGDKPGLLAFSRLDGGHETLAVFNTSTGPLDAQVVVEPSSRTWTSVAGACAGTAAATGRYHVRVPPLDYLVCRSETSHHN
ncbi:MAG TPA: alpha-amylase family glycosyl hydrolase [Sphingomicrobium sp.]|nr:alpha-amylase family glycosyl hydrolase [Sphingomicrobium sp.]